jgi:CBS-domain-containing membrane protein
MQCAAAYIGVERALLVLIVEVSAMIDQPTTRTCTVYRGRGESVVVFQAPSEAEPPVHRHASADAVTLREIMQHDVVCARADLDVRAVVHLMVKHRIGCIPVIDERHRPIGIITKFDLVEQLDAAMRAKADGAPFPADLLAREAGDVMMPLALTLPELATIAHAASMITTEDTHHVLVVAEDGTLAGVVSTRDIVVWLVANDAGFTGFPGHRHRGPR